MKEKLRLELKQLLNQGDGSGLLSWLEGNYTRFNSLVGKKLSQEDAACINMLFAIIMADFDAEDKFADLGKYQVIGRIPSFMEWMTREQRGKLLHYSLARRKGDITHGLLEHECQIGFPVDLFSEELTRFYTQEAAISETYWRWFECRLLPHVETQMQLNYCLQLLCIGIQKFFITGNKAMAQKIGLDLFGGQEVFTQLQEQEEVIRHIEQKLSFSSWPSEFRDEFMDFFNNPLNDFSWRSLLQSCEEWSEKLLPLYLCDKLDHSLHTKQSSTVVKKI